MFSMCNHVTQLGNTKARRKAIMKKKIVNTDRKIYLVSSLQIRTLFKHLKSTGITQLMLNHSFIPEMHWLLMLHRTLIGIWEYGGGGGALVAMSCLIIGTPWTAGHQAPLSIEFSRQEYWNVISFSIWEYTICKIIFPTF